MWRVGLLIFLIFLLPPSFLCKVLLAADEPAVGDHAKHASHGHEYTVEDLINHADTMYWVTMAERGSLTVIKHGFEYLEKADEKILKAVKQLKSIAQQLETDPSDEAHLEQIKHEFEEVAKQLKHVEFSLDQLASAEKLAQSIALAESWCDDFQNEIKSLRNDLKYQKKVHHNTHYGTFPLARFVTPTLFSDPRSSGSFELLDDPDEVAVREAAESLAEEILEAQTVVPQYDVVFVSKPHRSDLEDEALYVFNRQARFFVHNRRELAQIGLGPQQWDELYNLDLSADTVLALLNAFGRDDLLIVRMRKIDEVHHDFFYVAEAQVFDRAGAQANPTTNEKARPTLILNNYGFCIDRRHMLLPIILTHLILFGIALIAYRVMVRYSSHLGVAPSWENTFVMGSLGFLWGRLLMWIISPIMSGIEPAPETLAIWSFWWPAAAGVALVLGPAAVLHFAEHRFKFLGPAFGMFNRGGAVFATVSLGSAAFLSQTAFMYKDWEALSMIPPLVAGVMTSAYVLGRALDKTDAVYLGWGIAVLVLTLFLGIAWCIASWFYLWIVLAVLMGVAVCSRRQVVKKRTVKSDKPKSAPGDKQAAGPTEARDLVKAAYAPRYRETKSFDQLQTALKPWYEGKTVRIALIGAAGIGKSATLRAVEDKAAADISRVTVLRGHCSEPQDGSSMEPYKPFADAIAEHFAVNLLAPHANQMKHIDEALGGIFDSVVPFADILFPPSDHGSAGSKKEMFVAIAAMLRRLASQHPVLLIIDDVHWMDPASKELLLHLYDEFESGKKCPIAFLLASRDSHDPVLDRTKVQQVESLPLAQDEIQAILTHSLELQHHTAVDVLNAVGEHNDNLHWVFQIIAHLAQKGLLVWRDNGYTWLDSSIKLSEHMPEDYRHSLVSLVAKHPEYRRVLECAACLGPEFSVEAVSHGIGMTRLDLIHLLDRIESETGIIKDIRNKDDRFAFRSPFMLEVLRKILEVAAHGPHDPTLPQRIREYHHRLAMALEKTLDDSNAVLYPVANHYYAAGSRHADKALTYALKAAKCAAAQFQHDLAKNYIGMAKDCAKIAKISPKEVDRELLLIECREAHVEGRDRVVMAERGLAHLQAHPNSDFLVHRAVARACYDAGVDTRDQKHFAECVAVAEKMIDRFDKPLEQAEAHHWCGISLPLARADERRKHLKFAMSFLEGEDESSLDVLRCRSRIANSLAEQLSYGTADERRLAKENYELSIALKSREDVRDIEGLALAHGGLGRLHFFASEPNYETAREHFQKDLEYSEKIGSLTGQTKMHSLLGACELRLSDEKTGVETALEHYRAANALAEERVDKYFALAGLLHCCGLLDIRESANQYGNELVAFVKICLGSLTGDERTNNPIAAIPTYCVDNIKPALKACGRFNDEDWHKWLVELVENNRIAE